MFCVPPKDEDEIEKELKYNEEIDFIKKVEAKCRDLKDEGKSDN